jgi:hypothetical protein
MPTSSYDAWREGCGAGGPIDPGAVRERQGIIECGVDGLTQQPAAIGAGRVQQGSCVRSTGSVFYPDFLPHPT